MESGVLVYPGLNQSFVLALTAYMPWLLELDMGYVL